MSSSVSPRFRTLPGFQLTLLGLGTWLTRLAPVPTDSVTHPLDGVCMILSHCWTWKDWALNANALLLAVHLSQWCFSSLHLDEPFLHIMCGTAKTVLRGDYPHQVPHWGTKDQPLSRSQWSRFAECGQWALSTLRRLSQRDTQSASSCFSFLEALPRTCCRISWMTKAQHSPDGFRSTHIRLFTSTIVRDPDIVLSGITQKSWTGVYVKKGFPYWFYNT